jgi:hypothetical protein
MTTYSANIWVHYSANIWVNYSANIWVNYSAKKYSDTFAWVNYSAKKMQNTGPETAEYMGLRAAARYYKFGYLIPNQYNIY